MNSCISNLVTGTGFIYHQCSQQTGFSFTCSLKGKKVVMLDRQACIIVIIMQVELKVNLSQLYILICNFNINSVLHFQDDILIVIEMSVGGMPEGYPVQSLVKTRRIKQQRKFVVRIPSYQNILQCSNSHPGNYYSPLIMGECNIETSECQDFHKIPCR